MTKREYDEYQARKQLESAGFNVQQQDSVKFNGGSETRAHAHLKLSVAWYLKYHAGFRVDTEVEMGDGDIDVLAWKENDIVAIECETAPTKDVVSDKLSRYVNGTPVREMWVLDVNSAPANIHECYEWVAEEIGL